METITGIVNRIVYESPKNDFKVFKLKKKNNLTITVTGEFQNLVTLAHIEVHGEFKCHPKYGTSFVSQAYSFMFKIGDAYSVSLYIQSIAKWVGPQRALNIAEHFGKDIEKVIEEQPERLTEIDGIGQKVALSIAEAWQLNRSLKDIRIFLHGLGLTTLKIRRIISMYGPDTETILTENPWVLCLSGFGFSTCDHIAHKLQKDMSCINRLKYYAIYALKECSFMGHLYLRPIELLNQYNKYNKRSNYPFFNRDITINDIALAIKSLRDSGDIIIEDKKLYNVSCFFYENESARLLSNIKNSSDTCKLEDFELEDFIKEFERKNDLKLSAEQHFAVEAFTKEKVSVITGSPGSGKTLIVKALVKICQKKNISFELLTPTGIAAKKLGSTTGCPAYTIHRRFMFSGSDWAYNAINKYKTQVVIVDETSMVDQEVFYRLISSLYPSTKLVFVGDNDQLPSVGPGSVLKHLISCGTFKTTFLSTIFRQEECSDIIKEANRIRVGDTNLELFSSDNKADIWHIRSKDIKTIENLIVKFANQLKNSTKLSPEDRHFQIITPRNSGPLSVSSLNTLLQESLNPKSDDKKEITLNYQAIRKGDRVIIIKNNYEFDVFNGDIGKVAHISPEFIAIDIEDFSDVTRRVEIPLKIADDMIKLAYTITCHKCLPGSTLISTEIGFKYLRDIKVGDKVLTRNRRFRKVTLFSNTGVKESLVVHTKSGSFLKSSKDHMFLIANKGGMTYKKTSEIVPSVDYLCSFRAVTPGEELSFERTPHQIPPELTPHLSWLIGCLVAKGTYNSKDGYITFKCPKHPLVYKNMLDIFEAYDIPYEEILRKNKYLKIESPEFRIFLLSLGLGYDNFNEKQIPKAILASNVLNRQSFLASFFDLNASFSGSGRYGYIQFYVMSEKLAQDIRILLRSVGILSSVYPIINKRTWKFSLYKIKIFNISIDLLKKIPFINKDKRAVLETYKEARVSRSHEIPFGHIFAQSFKDAFEEQTGQKLVNKDKKILEILSHIKSHRIQMTRNLLTRLAKLAEKEGVTLPPFIEKTYKEHMSFDRVISVGDDTTEEMFDIEVEEDNSYTANGYICHNSQGMEYPIVILPFIKQHGSLLLQRNLLYTALTRAKKKVIILGQSSAIEDAILNDKIQKRNTIFADRINLWDQQKGISLRDMLSSSGSYQNAETLKQLLSLEDGATATMV